MSRKQTNEIAIIVIMQSLMNAAQTIHDNVAEPFDHETSALLTAMADYVRAKKKEREGGDVG